ncbi:MAG: response regulator [Planctomycetota bacterium]|jgi:CheY-like chemotaxis protein
MVEKRNVLFVDDDEIVLRSIERAFLDENGLFNQLFAKSGQEALEILQREEVHVIVTDMLMPSMDGLELLRTVRKEYPNITGIVLTGYEQDTELQNAVDQGEIFEFVLKPWKLETDFKKVVLKAIEHFNFQSECNTVRRQKSSVRS